VSKKEFRVQNAFHYNHKSPMRWLVSHVWRNKRLVIAAVALGLITNIAFAQGPVLIGRATGEIMQPTAPNGLLVISLLILATMIITGIADLAHALSIETLAQRLEVNVREELYASLLGKSQTFHNRQRVGNIIALATDDVQQLNMMMNPGIFFIFSTVIGIIVPVTFIATIRLELLIVPLIFIVAYVVTVRRYTRELNPIAMRQRMQSGKTNAVLEESISGIEVVKASAQEPFERHKFRRNARLFRDFFVRQGYIEARYLPLLLYGIATGFAFFHALILYQDGILTIPGIVGYMGLFNLLRFPTFISVFSFSLVQLGLASGERIYNIIVTETELDENVSGIGKTIEGDIVFENVTFDFNGNTVLDGVSFHVTPGETVAIVGQTGSGKSTLTQLINRTYDVTKGRILVDGTDVREWNIASLRSQISKIEQDVFLFSRTLAENIAFGKPEATQEEIERAAREAQAHDFIVSFADGYETKVGERGVTLSGGQRQRIALARAFLSNPRILILDDSTSAIDSATEDEIQKAIQRAQQGRTTLLITHRLSQIRWADHILVLDKSRLVASGTHDELLRRSPHYRRIFARYEVELPPLEETEPAQIAEQNA
jgi:ATP-binding cassette, subfamily B, bacterial